MNLLDNKNISNSTKLIYTKALVKIDISNLNELKDTKPIINKINQVYQSDESKKIIYNAICKVLEGTDLYNVYNNIRNELKRKIQYDKSDNVKALPMSYEDLIKIPSRVIEKDPRKQLVNFMFLYMHINYPLRLDYYNVPINKTDSPNYMTYDGKILTFYLNQFKNIKSMGPQVIKYEDPIINDYFSKLSQYIVPEYLLYRYNDGFKPFNSRVAFGNHLKDLIKKYTGVPLTINDIRKITESHVIQGSGYNMLSNREKNKLHGRLLHRTNTANTAYNFVRNTS